MKMEKSVLSKDRFCLPEENTEAERMMTECLRNCSWDSVTFADVAVDFTQEEWTLLDSFQRCNARELQEPDHSRVSIIGAHSDLLVRTRRRFEDSGEKRSPPRPSNSAG